MYTRFFCTVCDYWAVKCPTCSNPSCNGGAGIIDGKYCKDCEEAYRLMLSDSLMSLPVAVDNDEFKTHGELV